MKLRSPDNIPDVLEISIGNHNYKVIDGVVEVCDSCANQLKQWGWKQEVRGKREVKVNA